MSVEEAIREIVNTFGVADSKKYKAIKLVLEGRDIETVVELVRLIQLGVILDFHRLL